MSYFMLVLLLAAAMAALTFGVWLLRRELRLWRYMSTHRGRNMTDARERIRFDWEAKHR